MLCYVMLNHHTVDILRIALEGSVNQAAYQLQQNLGGGLKLDPPGSNFYQRLGDRQDEVGGFNPRQFEHCRGQRGSWMTSKIFCIPLAKFDDLLVVHQNFSLFSYQLSNFTTIRPLNAPPCCIMPRQRHFLLPFWSFTYIF